ncbi:MAG: hypothetical protein CTY35_10910 [Methylotenera sp.]|nr:MAG: hypothetical protein CTY35_10910 [Methylotenera sp.]
MKLLKLLIYALGLVASINASAEEGKDQCSTVKVQQSQMQVKDTNKVTTTEALNDEAVNQYHVLNTQFLGKRPYMEKFSQ